jgi:hypothetical protein
MTKIYQKVSLLKRWLIQTEHTDLYPKILNTLIDAYYDLVVDLDAGPRLVPGETRLGASERGPIDFFFQWVYSNTYLHHVRYQEKDYYERSNVWSKKMESRERPLHDPDNHCDSTDKITCDVPPELVPDDDTDVGYIIQKYDKSIFRSIVTDIKINGKRLAELDPDRVLLFSSISSIIFWNASGSNPNHRGSTHCQLHLAYEGVIAMDMPITLYQFATICYRLKSHKFNSIYESYERCDIHSRDKNITMINVYYHHID